MFKSNALKSWFSKVVVASLRNQIILLACCVSVFSSVLLGVAMIAHISAKSREIAAQSIMDGTELVTVNTALEIGWLTLLLAFCSLSITAFLAKRLTWPLKEIAQAVMEAEQTGTPLKLTVERKDEIGKLAHAFQSLIDSRIEHDARVSAIIDKVVDAIISIDTHGKVLSYNAASETLFGYTADEVIGKNIKLLMPKEIADAHDGYLSTYRQTGEKHIIGKTRELSARRKDGTFFPMELSVSRVDLSSGSYVFTGIVRDITERKQMEVMQNEFVSTVNHELRTPLTSIRASLGILQRRIAGKIDEKSEHLVDISLAGCERLGRLVNDILDLEKIAAGKMDFYVEVFDIDKLTAEIIERHQSLAEIHNIHFVLHGGQVPYFCMVDPSRFSQALVNLLSNAAKFSPAGGSVKIDLASSSANRVTISVTDEGPGIPEAFRAKIFQRFAQADGSATRAKGGSGLGLNITKSIIVAFGGTIDFESVEGEGTTFSMTLPICAAPEQQGEIPCKVA